MKLNTLYCGDNLEILKTIPNESVDCVVTSPPYWALRDYGIDGQLGLEPTFQEYITKLCDIFDEVKRVLKKSGTCWVVIGDTYFGSSGGRNADETPGKTGGFNKGNRGTQTGIIPPVGAKRVKSYDTSDKVIEDSLNYDYLCENLCDGCRRAYQIGKSHNESLLVSKQVVLSSLPNHENKEVVSDHSANWDSSLKDSHNSNAIQDSKHISNHEAEPFPVFRESKKDEFSLQLQDELKRKSSYAVCLCCGHSFVSDVQKSEHKKVCNYGIEKPLDSLHQNKLDNFSSDLAYLHYSKKSPEMQSKNLCNIPARFSIEMVNRGWILRNEIIWFKRNCMPSSVKDRLTVDFEKVFFFVKSKRYWFEQQYIPTATKDDSVRNRDITKLNNVPGRSRMAGLTVNNYDYRNTRCVWDIPTMPFKDAHFAVFPEKLVEPMIMAGCPSQICKKCGKAKEPIFKTEKQHSIGATSGRYWVERDFVGDNTVRNLSKKVGYTDCGCNVGFEGGICLDPFIGSGTTAVVARKLGRNYIGIDLNPNYIKMAEDRIKTVTPPLF